MKAPGELSWASQGLFQLSTKWGMVHRIDGCQNRKWIGEGFKVTSAPLNKESFSVWGMPPDYVVLEVKKQQTGLDRDR